MPLKDYHLFVGTYDRGLMAPDANHFEIKLNTGNDFYRIAVNVRSQDGSMLLVYFNENLQHELCGRIIEKFSQSGVYDINSAEERKSFGLDYLRRNLIGDFNLMTKLPNKAPGLDNDLEDKLVLALEKSKADVGSKIFVFGEKWPSTAKPDKYFPEISDQGIHDIHMNQGNPVGKFQKDNGVYQDGGLLIYYPSLNRWACILLAFQTQFNTLTPKITLHTDDATGNRIVSPIPPPNPDPNPNPNPDPSPIIDGTVVIVGALVNPKGGGEEGKEKVILLNTTDTDISLNNWKLIDRMRRAFVIKNTTIKAGDTALINLTKDSECKLGNSGGTISLLNAEGIKTSGVQYTKEQAQTEGKTIKL